MAVQGEKGMEPKYTYIEEMQVMGIEVRTTNHQEANPTTATIPKLWNWFFEEQLLERIPNKVRPNVLLGAYTNYTSDRTGEFSLVVATEVNNIDNPPEGMVGITIPAGHYLVFTARGELPDAVILAWKQVWSYFSSTNTAYRRTYKTDFELYKQQNEVDLYIAVMRIG
jgi:predicted transcriptional regulator YdeE